MTSQILEEDGINDCVHEKSVFAESRGYERSEMTEHQMNQGEFESWLKKHQQSEGNDADAKKALEPYRVTNAVIMAAGLSNRFVPLSFEKPKGLLKVKGEVLIEREIRQLREAGIASITVVVGYMKELFKYLEEAFHVELVVNEDYDRCNNTSTLMKVRDRLDNTYICSSDNYFSQNPFEPYVYQAFYAAVYGKGETNEYCLQTDEQGMISSVAIGGSNAWYMLGHVYFDRDFSRRFVKILESEYRESRTKAELWENMYMRHTAELPLYIRKYPTGVIYEFDTLEELRAFDETYKTESGSEIMRFICGELQCTEADITHLHYMESDGDLQAFSFEMQGKQYRYESSLGQNAVFAV